MKFNISENSIAEIKNRLSIFDIARHLCIDLKGKRGIYHSPFRQDRKPSFSISKDGQAFFDFATGEKGDTISFYQLATNNNFKDSIKNLSILAGIGAKTPVYSKRVTDYPKEKNRLEKPNIPPLEWSETDARKLEVLRGYCIESLRIAFKRKVFGFANYQGHRVYIVTDIVGRVAQARRLDGGLFKDLNGGHKAETLKNSICSIPVGIDAIKTFPIVALCEGGTDFLASFHFAYIYDCENEVAPIALLGATHSIHKELLPTFIDKDVIIFADNDEAGAKGLENWGKQIHPYAKRVLYFSFKGFHTSTDKAVKDLSDFMNLETDEWENLRPYTNPYFTILNERNN